MHFPYLLYIWGVWIWLTRPSGLHRNLPQGLNISSIRVFWPDQIYLISLSKFNLPLIGTFTWPTPPGPYRATTCRGRELNYESHTYFFDHTRTWRASPDEWSTQRRGHLRDSTNMKDNTHQAHAQSSQQGEYGMMMTTAKWYSGTLGALSFPIFVLQVRKNPEKTSPRKLVPTGDRTRACCVTSAHATTCSTAVDAVVGKHVGLIFGRSRVQIPLSTNLTGFF